MLQYQSEFLSFFFKRSLIWLVHKRNWQLGAIEFVTKRLFMLKIGRAVVSKAQLGAAYLGIVCVACAPFTSPLLARGLVQLLVGLLLISWHLTACPEHRHCLGSSSPRVGRCQQ